MLLIIICGQLTKLNLCSVVFTITASLLISFSSTVITLLFSKSESCFFRCNAKATLHSLMSVCPFICPLVCLSPKPPAFILHLSTFIHHLPILILHLPTFILHLPSFILHLPTFIIHFATFKLLACFHIIFCFVLTVLCSSVATKLWRSLFFADF